jgi:hypothetical protein
MFAFLAAEQASLRDEFAFAEEGGGSAGEELAFGGVGRASRRPMFANARGMSSSRREESVWLEEGSIPDDARFAFVAVGRSSRGDGIAEREARTSPWAEAFASSPARHARQLEDTLFSSKSRETGR